MSCNTINKFVPGFADMDEAERPAVASGRGERSSYRRQGSVFRVGKRGFGEIQRNKRVGVDGNRHVIGNGHGPREGVDESGQLGCHGRSLNPAPLLRVAAGPVGMADVGVDDGENEAVEDSEESEPIFLDSKDGTPPGRGVGLSPGFLQIRGILSSRAVGVNLPGA